MMKIIQRKEFISLSNIIHLVGFNKESSLVN